MRAALSLLVLVSCSSPTSSDCVTLATTAQQSIDGRLAFFHDGCSSDLDCVLVPASVSCFTGCPDAVLATSMGDALNDLAGHDSDICMGQTCNIRVGCNPSHAACVMGICQAVEGADAGQPDAGMDAGLPDAGAGDGGP
jgi:hypothetical protein